ncbi:MAG TPA: COQ9 family protein, partial [Hyphomonas sp.]|nr:COQ9 family protein [Hyphomonas sp.]
MTQTPSEVLRFRWLDAMLPDVPFDGWTEATAARAAKQAGLSEGEQALAAPNGVPDLIDAFFDRAGQA